MTIKRLDRIIKEFFEVWEREVQMAEDTVVDAAEPEVMTDAASPEFIEEAQHACELLRQMDQQDTLYAGTMRSLKKKLQKQKDFTFTHAGYRIKKVGGTNGELYSFKVSEDENKTE